MALLVKNSTKKGLKELVGKPFPQYEETRAAWFEPEYKRSGSIIVTNDPRSYFAKVTVSDGIITRVE